MNKYLDINILIGHLIIGSYFIIFGAIFKIFNYEFAYEYMLDHNVPLTHLALVATIIIQLFCSIGIIIGRYTKSSSFILVTLVLMINFYMHNFWDIESGLQQKHEMQNFIKNLGIVAGLLILSGVDPGRYSLRK